MNERVERVSNSVERSPSSLFPINSIFSSIFFPVSHSWPYLFGSISTKSMYRGGCVCWTQKRFASVVSVHHIRPIYASIKKWFFLRISLFQINKNKFILFTTNESTPYADVDGDRWYIQTSSEVKHTHTLTLERTSRDKIFKSLLLEKGKNKRTYVYNRTESKIRK